MGLITNIVSPLLPCVKKLSNNRKPFDYFQNFIKSLLLKGLNVFKAGKHS